ncbi:WD40 repeat-like protein [Nadsonia fulvescens var. elongata DSM 6958]|uniref:Ribosome biogenesis protein NSA1 n=1 Tax=Nadsonia fulvescens var. elongata DSM 6958 TaxID=857566 RepID=A0A1E3PM92_9ASCO|nr:WD40 repeat-like protein [Nadsonia fulvescens var. elongata DSM 6958]
MFDTDMDFKLAKEWRFASRNSTDAMVGLEITGNSIVTCSSDGNVLVRNLMNLESDLSRDNYWTTFINGPVTAFRAHPNQEGITASGGKEKELEIFQLFSNSDPSSGSIFNRLARRSIQRSRALRRHPRFHALHSTLVLNSDSTMVSSFDPISAFVSGSNSIQNLSQYPLSSSSGDILPELLAHNGVEVFYGSDNENENSVLGDSVNRDIISENLGEAENESESISTTPTEFMDIDALNYRSIMSNLGDQRYGGLFSGPTRASRRLRPGVHFSEVVSMPFPSPIDDSQRLWKAKNVLPDEYGVRSPVWVSDIQWLDTDRSADLGWKLAVCTRFGELRIYDTRISRKPIIDITINQSPIVNLRLHKNNPNIVIFSDAQNTIGIFDYEKCELIKKIKSSGSTVNHLDIIYPNDDSKMESTGAESSLNSGMSDNSGIYKYDKRVYIVAGGFDNSIRVFDMESGKLVRKISIGGKSSRISSLAILDIQKEKDYKLYKTTPSLKRNHISTKKNSQNPKFKIIFGVGIKV